LNTLVAASHFLAPSGEAKEVLQRAMKDEFQPAAVVLDPMTSTIRDVMMNTLPFRWS
jgi:hypothetical protein